jgi:competence protein ComEA
MCGRTASIHVTREQGRFLFAHKREGGIMRMFFWQNKKIIALCAVPIIAVVTLIGYEVIQRQDNRSEPLAVNKGMKALLEQDVKQTATPSPTEAKSPEVAELPLVSMLPDATVKPKKTAKPKPTTKPKRTTKPKGTFKPKVTAHPKQTQNPDFKININKAMTEELMKLSGIGESKAKAIIAYRDAHHFQTLDELMKVKGIGPKIFEKIKAQLEL